MANQVGQIRGGFDIYDLNEQEIDLNTYPTDVDINNLSREERKEYLKNITMPFESEKWIKLGIQAPPGSEWEINDKKILIGRTGIYELDDDIVVTSLKYKSGDFKNIIIDYLEKEEVSR